MTQVYHSEKVRRIFQAKVFAPVARSLSTEAAGRGEGGEGRDESGRGRL